MQAFFYLLQRDAAFKNWFIGPADKKNILIGLLMTFLLHITCHVILSIGQNVCLFVCLLVTFSHSVFLEIQNPWGKVIGRRNLRFEQFCSKTIFKKSFFYDFFSISSLRLNVFFLPLHKVQCLNYFFFLNIFWILEEQEWKEGVSDLKTFAHKGCNIADFFVANFALLAGASICIGREILCLPYAVFLNNVHHSLYVTLPLQHVTCQKLE